MNGIELVKTLLDNGSSKAVKIQIGSILMDLTKADIVVTDDDIIINPS